MTTGWTWHRADMAGGASDSLDRPLIDWDAAPPIAELPTDSF